MARITFRKRKPSDDSYIVRLTKQNMAPIIMEAWGKPFSESDLLSHIQGAETTVVEYDGKRAGYYTVMPMGGRIHVGSMMVDSKYQSKGIGTTSFERIEYEALQRGFEAVELFVQTNNPRAIQLYERLGYVNIGMPYPSTIHMVKRLNASVSSKRSQQTAKPPSFGKVARVKRNVD